MTKAKEAIQTMIEKNLRSQTQMGKSFESMGIDPKVARVAAPLDDGENPATPKNVEATSFLKAVMVEWDAPPDTDAVAYYEIEVSTTGDSYIYTSTETGISHVFHDLPYEEHSFRVRFTDRFNRSSGWSASVTASPARSAQYEIDLTAAQILGNLKGLLPNENLDTIEDATKLGQGVVLAEAMAVQDAAAMNLWVDNGAIQNAMIGNAAIDTAQIANLAVTTAKIADLSVTNAKINSIIANKIVTSTLTATTITIGNGGKIQSAGGGVILSDSGLQLDYETVVGRASDNVSRKVTSIGHWGSLSFFAQSSPTTRGVMLRADGLDGGDNAGGIYLISTPNGTNAANSTATLDVNALTVGNIVLTANNIVLRGKQSNSTIAAQSDTSILGYNKFTIGLHWTPITLSGNGSFLDFTHNLGAVPNWIMWQYRDSSQTDWRNLTDATSNITCHFDNDSGRITNNRGVSIVVRGFIANA